MIEIKLQALKSFKNWVNPLRKHRISEGKGRCGIALNFPCFKDGRADSFLVSSLSALLGRTSAGGGRLKAVSLSGIVLSILGTQQIWAVVCV